MGNCVSISIQTSFTKYISKIAEVPFFFEAP
jgi:hypothetical protein